MLAGKRAHVRAKGQVNSFDLDAYTVLGINRKQALYVARRYGVRSLSEKEAAYLTKQGIAYDPETEEGLALARAALKKCFERINGGLCSWKQSRTLQKNGFPGDLSFVAARAVLDKLAANRWRSNAGERAEWIQEAIAFEHEQGGRDDGP